MRKKGGIVAEPRMSHLSRGYTPGLLAADCKSSLARLPSDLSPIASLVELRGSSRQLASIGDWSVERDLVGCAPCPRRRQVSQ